MRTVLAILQGQLGSIPDERPQTLPITYVEEYHQAIDELEALGYSMKPFRIPDSAYRQFRSFNTLTRQQHVGARTVDSGSFVAKLLAVLEFFRLDDRRIGFEGPRS